MQSSMSKIGGQEREQTHTRDKACKEEKYWVNPWTASGILEIVCILLNYNWHKTFSNKFAKGSKSWLKEPKNFQLTVEIFI